MEEKYIPSIGKIFIDNTLCGTAWIVKIDEEAIGMALTAAHCIKNLKTQILHGKSIFLEFQCMDKIKVEKVNCDNKDQFALLKFTLPDNYSVQQLPLIQETQYHNIIISHQCWVYGHLIKDEEKKTHGLSYEGRSLQGTIQALEQTVATEDGTLIKALKLYFPEITEKNGCINEFKGISGAPVFHIPTGRVIGLVQMLDMEEVPHRIHFANHIKDIIHAFEELKQLEEDFEYDPIAQALGNQKQQIEDSIETDEDPIPFDKSNSLINYLKNFVTNAFDPDGLNREYKSAFLKKYRKNTGTEQPWIESFRSYLPPINNKKLRILELACYNAPLLANLFQEHEEIKDEPCNHFNRIICYLGVDKQTSPRLKNEYDNLGSKCKICFPEVEFFPHDILECLESLKAKGPYDFITLSNVLHELPPDMWPILFANIPEMLSNDGKFILLDLDVERLFNEGYFIKENDEEINRSRWEANAIWITKEDAKQLIKETDLEIEDALYPNLNNWWLIKAIKKTNPVRKITKAEKENLFHQRKIKLDQCVIQILERQHNNWLEKKLRAARQNACKQKICQPTIGTEFVLTESDRIKAALRYFCLCATHCMRDESIFTLSMRGE